jgi:hypothetical protein
MYSKALRSWLPLIAVVLGYYGSLPDRYSVLDDRDDVAGGYGCNSTGIDDMECTDLGEGNKECAGTYESATHFPFFNDIYAYTLTSNSCTGTLCSIQAANWAEADSCE